MCDHDMCERPRLLLVWLEVRLAHRRKLELAWEDAWNPKKIKPSVKWLSYRTDLLGHDAVTCGAQAKNHFTIVVLLWVCLSYGGCWV